VSITARWQIRLQDSTANCGAVALRNALLALGIARSTEECEKLCRTDATNGTKASNLVKAVRAIDGCRGLVIDDSRTDVALLRLEKSLRSGTPSVLLVDGWSHYIAAIGMLGERFLVADSADSELVLSLDPGELIKRWGCDGARRPYWGIVL
jgi:hypothetical protein